MGLSFTFETTALFIQDGEQVELDCTVEYEYHRGYRGMRDSCGGVRGAGPALEPDEPAHCEVLAVTVLDDQAPNQDKVRDMTEQLEPGQMAELEITALEMHNFASEPDPDAQRERMMDRET